MQNVPKSKLAKAITVTAMLTSGKTLPPEAVDAYIARLARYPEDAISDALRRCQDEVKGHLALRDIIERIDDGHPTAEEAWGMCPKDENQSVVWTDEIAAAFTSTLDMDDKVAARMAFKETYQRLVRDSRAEGKEIHFYLSAGRDVAGRDAAVSKAVALGRLPASKVEASHQLPPAAPDAIALPAPEVPLTDIEDRPATDEERMYYTRQIREMLGMPAFKVEDV